MDKPSGLPTHPSINHYTDTLANGVIAYINDADFTIHIVNRLDRETSGVVLFAKHMLSAHLLSLQIKNHELKKTYYALTENIPPNEKGIINAPIARECESIIKRCVREDGKPSETLYKVLKAKNNNALILAEPLTGRTHQIRVYFSYINCPLAGDNLYGNGIQRDRLYLHCASLFFKHPVTGTPVTVKSKLPEEFTV